MPAHAHLTSVPHAMVSSSSWRPSAFHAAIYPNTPRNPFFSPSLAVFSSDIAGILSLLSIVLQDLNVVSGLTCNPIAVISSSGGSCCLL
ncbi:hypothetical protein BT96DRAFT_1014135 [Gymnopus androsaceus JB14]|uniref:Uncharacterized protein n=1 Tax=Gymnopus androsaceus JB14 TaxID=1447944 RepID=A0A6A4IAL0_9AGAR|nr:hypothetical protein BT96DRAFT_1014135 [Gymnopus androsaceus JB14]